MDKDQKLTVAIAAVAALGAAAAAGAAVGAAYSMQKLLFAQLSAPRAEEAAAAGTSARRSSFTSAKAENAPAVFDGFSMEQARQHADEGQEEAARRAPPEVLAELQRGNARFWMGAATRPERSAFERRALITKQFPSAAILGCADSRVPVEIVFDQGLGDLFVVRVAGNCLATSTTGSLQYAVHHLKVKVLIVMGHEFCGAIKAAGLPDETLEKEPAALCDCLKGLKGGLDLSRIGGICDPRARDREAVISNVNKQVAGLTQDEGIMKKVNAGELIIVGAFYEISSGIVDFFSEVSQGGTQPGVEKAPSRGVFNRLTPQTK